MKLFNSFSNKLEEFKTLKSKEVKLYVCGITPYDVTHLGHAFVYVTFDALNRFLKFKGYKVKYTQNVTDIDDDILKRAKEEKRDWKELGDFWTDKFLSDMKSLNVRIPNQYIRATSAIDEVIEMIQILMRKGFAYEKKGNIYFQVSNFSDYGKLSKYSKKEMLKLLKMRGGNPDDPNKKAPLDFLLWQRSISGEPFWDSPFSKGRPGWHIECSAMIKKTLGDQIDIHGGGRDLIYPHHESELAQSNGASAKKPVKYWMHTGMVSYRGDKMSKSLGNLVLVSDLLEKYSPNTIRLMLLLNHYRKSWKYSKDLIESASKIIDQLETNFRRQPPKFQAKTENGMNKLLSGLDDDFNTRITLERLISQSQTYSLEAKAGFELLGFKF